MISAGEVPALLEEAKKKMDGPFLPSKSVAKVVFVGDTHTAVDVTQKVFDTYYEAVDLIVFLGDYVDRGDTGVENLGLILSKFVDDRNKIVMLRGNHESPLTNFHYGFASEVASKFGEDGYQKFKDFFSVMPYATVVNGYFCAHGGIAMDLHKVEELMSLPTGDANPDNPTAFQVLWNDPRDMIDGFIPSVRGEGAFYFGADVTEKFLSENELKGIIRAHEVVNGFREDMGGKVITVFSSRYHGGQAGALVIEGDKMEQQVL